MGHEGAAASRADVPAPDGLRALSALIVLGLHDLFFVLSGYLITSLLVTELTQTGRVALGAFYARRPRRPCMSQIGSW